MRHRLHTVSVALLLAVVVSPLAAAETKAVQTMSAILMKLNHFPSDEEKKSLQQILDDKTTTADERVVAQALMNVKHKPAAEDQAKLEAVAKGKTASESVKTLATIVAGLNHTPSEADKEKLKKLSSS